MQILSYNLLELASRYVSAKVEEWRPLGTLQQKVGGHSLTDQAVCMHADHMHLQVCMHTCCYNNYWIPHCKNFKIIMHAMMVVCSHSFIVTQQLDNLIGITILLCITIKISHPIATQLHKWLIISQIAMCVATYKLDSQLRVQQCVASCEVSLICYSHHACSDSIL